MPKEKMSKDDINNRWSTYESNVQAYRSNMIASQSFLLTVGAVLLDKNAILLCLCVLVALFQQWFIWYRVIRTRIIISDYYKFNLYNSFNNDGDIFQEDDVNLKEETYLKNTTIRKEVNRKLAEIKNSPKLKHNLRLTRIKLDIIMPISFSVIWLSFFAAALISIFKL